MANGNPFYVRPANLMPGLQALGAGLEKRQAVDTAEQAKQQMQADFQAAMDLDTPDAWMNFAVKNPQMQQVAMKQFGITNKETGEIFDRVAFDTLRAESPEDMVSVMQAGIEEVQGAGGNPVNMSKTLQGLMSEDPETKQKAFEDAQMFVKFSSPEVYKAVAGQDDIDTQIKLANLNIKQEGLKLRKQEADLRKLQQAADKESNELKRQELQLKIEKRQNDIDQSKKDVQEAGELALSNLDNSISTVDRLLSHPGLESAVGMSLTPGFTIPGTEKADFLAELDAFDAQNFLTAIKQMKGMGALSDAEGKKVSAAVGAINPSMSEKAFKRSLNTIRDGFERARSRLAGPQQEPSEPPATNDKGWGLMIDAQGNKAYVGPNGEIEEI